jgi:hypothetical protein
MFWMECVFDLEVKILGLAAGEVYACVRLM